MNVRYVDILEQMFKDVWVSEECTVCSMCRTAPCELCTCVTCCQTFVQRVVTDEDVLQKSFLAALYDARGIGIRVRKPFNRSLLQYNVVVAVSVHARELEP